MKRKTILIMQHPFTWSHDEKDRAQHAIKSKAGDNCEIVLASTLKTGEPLQFYSFEVTEDGTGSTQDNG